MAEQFLYEKLDVAKEVGIDIDFPEIIKSGLSKRIFLREYQTDAFTNFATQFAILQISDILLNVFVWHRSSAGQSVGLISPRSLVRAQSVLPSGLYN